MTARSSLFRKNDAVNEMSVAKLATLARQHPGSARPVAPDFAAQRVDVEIVG